MLLHNDRIGSQRVEHRMGKTAVVIRCEILGQENGRDSGGNHDCKNHLLHLVGAKSLFMILQCLSAIHEQRVTAHMAGCHAKGCKMLQPLIP